jgi:DNA-binding response OmpR family regulator
MKVLLVEDDRKISSFIKKALKEQGFIVDACENGDDGYALASGQSYDVILLEVRAECGRAYLGRNRREWVYRTMML